MRTWIFLGVLFKTINLYGQSTESIVPHIPTSPQAEALNIYGGYDINYSTGTPDISIPLYEIDHHGYKIPVSLRYSPQPLKSGYNYDVVGQGWTLSVNGCISRTIEYEPDELNDFVLEVPESDYVRLCGNSCLLYKNYAHDKFSAILPNGTSFEFIIDKQNNIRKYTVSGGRNVKIDCGVGNSQIGWFTVIDEDGVKYTFDGGDTPYHGPENIYSSHYVSWQLGRIDLPYSPEPIVFANNYLIQSPYNTTCPEPVIKFGDYYNANYLDEGIPSAHTYFADKTMEYPNYSYKMSLLSKISYGPQGGSQLRVLYKNASGSAYNYIDKIQVWEDVALIKEINFDISVHDILGQCGTSLAKLDGLSITGSNPQDAPLVYSFAYGITPGGFSGTDHWGYRSYASNNAMPNFTFFSEWGENLSPISNAGMMPVTKTTEDVSPMDKFSLSNYPYSDTRTTEEPNQHGILQKITYPTGGYTLFEFEKHHFFSHTDFNGNYILDKSNRVIRQGGGFRIKTIENYSKSGIRTDKKNFRYGKTYSQIPGSYGSLNTPNGHTGAGEPVVDPNILTYMNFSSYPLEFPVRFMILGLNSQGQHQPFIVPFGESTYFNFFYWDCTFSALNFRRLLNGRPAVLYDQVTVYEGDIDEYNNIFPLGKTVYNYNLSGSNVDDDTFEQPLYYGNMLGYIPKSYRYNKLLSKTDYRYDSGAFHKVKAETNTWNWITSSSFDYQYSNPYPQGHQPEWTTVPQVFTGKPFFIGYGCLQNKTLVDYSTEIDSIIVSESFSYNGRGQVIRKETMDSSDDIILRTSYEYPEVSASGITPAIILSLIDKNLISPIIRTTRSFAPIYSSTFQDLAATKTEYFSFGSNRLLPAKQYNWEVRPSISEYVLRDEVLSYSINGNPLEIVSDGELHTAYLWGYGDRYTTVMSKNAIFNEIYFESFEEPETSLWGENVYPTGSYGWPLAFDATKAHSGERSGRVDDTNPGWEAVSHSNKWLGISLAAPKKFHYSGWVYSNGPSAELFLLMKRTGETGYNSYFDNVSTTETNKWVYLEKDFLVPADVTSMSIRVDCNSLGSVWFDDLRIHPSDAQMTTYTYRPLVGMTSMTDAKGMTTHYGYDGFQRLKTIKDNNGNILKNYEYHYKDQP